MDAPKHNTFGWVRSRVFKKIEDFHGKLDNNAIIHLCLQKSKVAIKFTLDILLCVNNIFKDRVPLIRVLLDKRRRVMTVVAIGSD